MKYTNQLDYTAVNFREARVSRLEYDNEGFVRQLTTSLSER